MSGCEPTFLPENINSQIFAGFQNTDLYQINQALSGDFTQYFMFQNTDLYEIWQTIVGGGGGGVPDETLKAANADLSTPRLISTQTDDSKLWLSDSFVGINNATPTELLHILAEGNSGLSSPVLIQDSLGQNLFEIVDNGILRSGGITKGVQLEEYVTGVNQVWEQQKVGNTVARRMRLLSGNNVSEEYQNNYKWRVEAFGTLIFQIQDANRFSFNVVAQPRGLGTAAKLALPATLGGIVFDTDLGQLSYYNGVAWVNI